MGLEIERVHNQQQLQEFIRVAWQVYAHDPYWVPWLYFERLAFFDRRRNPFFEHAEADYFIARRDGRAVGAIAAILNHRHNEFHQENVAHFGAFEVLEDREAALALLNQACAWARQKGANKIIGPATLSTNDESGLLIEGFDAPPVMLMTYNPRYYIGFVEAAGFTKAMDLLAWDFDLPYMLANVPEKIQKANAVARQAQQITLRPVNMRDWDREVARVKAIYNSAWEKNWGFVPFTEKEFQHLTSGLKAIVDPRILFLAEHEGEPIGFGLALPDVNEILHRLRPGPSRLSSYLAGARMALQKRSVRRMRVIILGVLEQYRTRGVGAMLYLEIVAAAVKAGYDRAEGSWILETNDNMNRPLAMLHGKVYKRYRMYEKNL